jgi:hypothetical protein
LHIKTSCPAFFIFLFCTFSAAAQTNELIGRIALENGNTMSYKVIFNDSAGVVTGYSISDPGPNQTKAIIKGTINRDKKSFSFSETNVLNAKDKSVEYCLLKCTCKISQHKGMQLFKGKVTGYIGGNTSKPCGKGTVAFSTPADILKFTQKLIEKIDTNKLNKEQKQTLDSFKKAGLKITQKPIAKVYTNKLNEEQKQTLDSFKKAAITTSMNLIDAKKGAAFNWDTDSIRIDVYDDGEVDYDRVTILMDDNKILDNHTSKKEKYTFTIPISGGKHVLKFHAENEGNTPPNTTKFILWDGGIKHLISTNLHYGQDATIEIER